MARSKDKIIKGYEENCKIFYFNKDLVFEPKTTKFTVHLDKDTIDSYEVVTEDTTKSASSAIMRGLGGALFLGGIGLLAGLSAKNKSVYLIAIKWKNGESSLIELNDQYYKIFIKNNF